MAYLLIKFVLMKGCYPIILIYIYIYRFLEHYLVMELQEAMYTVVKLSSVYDAVDILQSFNRLTLCHHKL